MPEPQSGGNGGPWWSRLSIAALAIVSFVYLAEKIGGTYLDLLNDDLHAQREISAKIAEALNGTATESRRRNELFIAHIEEIKERNRIHRRILEELQKPCP